MPVINEETETVFERANRIAFAPKPTLRESVQRWRVIAARGAAWLLVMGMIAFLMSLGFLWLCGVGR